jgi:hypothetical protein
MHYGVCYAGSDSHLRCCFVNSSKATALFLATGVHVLFKSGWTMIWFDYPDHDNYIINDKLSRV